jgi:signal recognition particle subunit SRP54
MFTYLSQKLHDIFSTIAGQKTLTAQNIEASCDQVFQALIEADVPYAVAQSFLDQVKKAAMGIKVTGSLKPGEQFIKLVYDELTKFLGGTTAAFNLQLPATVLVMGLQGAGKTTFLGKLAHAQIAQAQQKNKQRSVLMASVDFQRPAAIDQLEVVSRQAGASFYRATTTNTLDAVKEIIAYRRAQGFEILLLDTAGRLHVDTALLKELTDICSLVQPTNKILVLDGMIGQESLHVAQEFTSVGFDGVVMTKMDGSARGGAAFAFSYQLKKPIFYIGTGEKLTDLTSFHPDRMAQRILGMGDLLTLIEQAEASVKKEEQEKMAQRMMAGTITLEDFAQQLAMMGRMGSLTSLVQYLPGAQKVSEAQISQAEIEMKQFKAIIGSMTPKERKYPEILTGARKARVAKGSGTTPATVNQLLSRFEQCKQFVKLAKQFGKGHQGRGPWGR